MDSHDQYHDCGHQNDDAQPVLYPPRDDDAERYCAQALLPELESLLIWNKISLTSASKIGIKMKVEINLELKSI